VITTSITTTKKIRAVSPKSGRLGIMIDCVFKNGIEDTVHITSFTDEHIWKNLFSKNESVRSRAAVSGMGIFGNAMYIKDKYHLVALRDLINDLLDEMESK
jgi:hypothetical protein